MASTTAADVVTIISNVMFLLPAAQAAYMKRWTRFCIFLLIVVFSSMYHACNSFSNLCVFESTTHRWLDFFFAQLTIPITALYIVIFPPEWQAVEHILIISWAVTIGLVQHMLGESIYIQMMVSAVSLGSILVYWIIYAATEAVKHPTVGMHLPPYEWDMFAMGIGLTAVACSLYATEMQYHLFYWGIHGVWHSCAALGQYFLLLIRPIAPYAAVASLDRRIQKRIKNVM